MQTKSRFYNRAADVALDELFGHLDELKAQWLVELEAMRLRINELRKSLSEKITASRIARDFSFIAGQSGMFSFMGITVEQIQRLRNEFAIYTVNSSRINVASLNQGNMDYFVEALATVLDE